MWVLGDKLILFGGKTAAGYLADLWEYSIGTNSWTNVNYQNVTDFDLTQYNDPSVVMVPQDSINYNIYIYGGVNRRNRVAVNNLNTSQGKCTSYHQKQKPSPFNPD